MVNLFVVINIPEGDCERFSQCLATILLLNASNIHDLTFSSILIMCFLFDQSNGENSYFWSIVFTRSDLL